MEKRTLVKLSSVSKSYRRGWFGKPAFAIRDIDLTIVEGESVGFIGHNGAGKSSTIRIMMGQQRPTSGSAMMNGRPVEDTDSRRGVGYVPENPLAYDYLTPLELVETGIAMARLAVPSRREHAMQWLERFRIAHAASRPLRALSKGMVQRTMLAHALAVKPHLLVLDEPLSGLDPVGRAEVVEVLQEYREGGGALLFSSHILSDVERLADRFVFIHKGAIRASCSVYEIFKGDDQVFELLAELPSTVASVAGWGRVGENVWQRSASRENIAACLGDIQARGGRILSVRNLNSLENAYLKLVREAG